MSLSERYDARVRAGELMRDPAQEYAAMALDNFAATYRAAMAPRGPLKRLLGKKTTAKGLYLYGGVGRGKTMLMDLLVTDLHSNRVRRVHFHAFMLEIHARLKSVRDKGTNEDFLGHVAADIAKDIDLLCFDEIHVNDIADAMILGPLFEQLMQQGVTIVATSNYHPDDLYKNGLQRARFLPFIELLKQRMSIVRLDSPTDYRLRALSDAGTWFYPLTDASWSNMNALFETLAPQTAPTGMDITGRPLPIERADARHAWIGFDTLCRENRGASDYLALGAMFDAVFVDGVPRMGEDMRNEARRFMTLIDTLYDAKKIVVLRAAARPNELYDGTTNAFEWERTVSRLLEMQSPDWIDRRQSPEGLSSAANAV